MHQKADDVLSRLPSERREDLLPVIREQFLQSKKTVVILDDDPTGTQTCYDVIVLTAWDVSLLVDELKKSPSILFILTNSRSLTSSMAIKLAKEIGENLLAAKKESGRDIVIISRSDSTLRGHFPAEVDALASALNMNDAVRVLVPVFVEGGRFTIDDVHYIREQDRLVPVADTPFAHDAAFGYKHSNLREWVEEKTKGKVKAKDIVSISLDDIRIRGVEQVAAKLGETDAGGVCIVNACSHRDLEILVMGILKAELLGRKFIYRTSATFVSIRAGLRAGKIFQAEQGDQQQTTGSLVVVGSYVPKTTRQLRHLLQDNVHQSIEVSVPTLLQAKQNNLYAEQIIRHIDECLKSGLDVVLHTSRELEKGTDAESSLQINSLVSTFLVKVVGGLSARPAFIVSKGGITSSDLATKALNAKRALVLGQIIPGVPIWKMGDESKYPEILYTVFPGNVGDDEALKDVWRKLKN